MAASFSARSSSGRVRGMALHSCLAALLRRACSRTGPVLAEISYHPLVHVHIGPLSISPHGVGIAVGFLAGARLMLPEATRKGIRDEQVYAMLTRAAIGAIIGARLAYVVNHAGDYSSFWDI